MNIFRDFSIKRKLTLIAMLTSTISLLLVCIAFITYEVVIFQHRVLDELKVSAEMIANNCTAAIVFQDQETAGEILAALRIEDQIVSAGIFTADDRLFALYTRNGAVFNPATRIKTEQHRFDEKYLYLSHPIVLHDEEIGSIYIQYEMTEMKARLKQYATIVIVIFLLSLLVSLAIATNLQKIISKPILHIMRIAKKVSQEKDYSLRAIKESNDELGVLVDGFNEMLMQIQKRDMTLQRYQEELEHRVQERTEALQLEIMERKRAEHEKERIQAQLLQAQKMEAIGVLAGGVAHDFNNLLTAIQGCTNLAMEELGETHRVFDDLKEIQTATRRATDLTHQLLLFSRKQPMKAVMLDMNDCIKSLLKMFSRLIEEDIEIITEFEDDLWTVEGDRGTLEQVIMNLVVNAKDAMPRGGKIHIKSDNVIIDSFYCKSMPEARIGKYVRISVSDTGIGISNEDLRHIFEPFFTTKGIGRGTGLGLSVIYGIVKQHEGWINVYSDIGHGTTFKVYLPAVKVKKNNKEVKEPVLEALKGNGETILVVEDESNVREFSRKALTKYGYNTIIASNLEEAKKMYINEKDRLDLIFSDVVLPDGSGIELVDYILKDNPALRILLTSGYTDHKSQWPVIQQRGYRFLQKPYALADLLRIIRETIGNSAMVTDQQTEESSAA